MKKSLSLQTVKLEQELNLGADLGLFHLRSLDHRLQREEGNGLLCLICPWQAQADCPGPAFFLSTPLGTEFLDGQA